MIVTRESLQTAIEGLHEEPDFPNREHIRGLIAIPHMDALGDDAIQVTVLTDDTLLGEPFAYPMNVTIRRAIAERMKERGFEDYVYLRLVEESDYLDAMSDEDE